MDSYERAILNLQKRMAEMERDVRILKRTEPIGGGPILTTNVSNPPTDAQLDAAFGTPANVSPGMVNFVDDAGAGTAFYLVISDGTNWWIFTGTKAV